MPITSARPSPKRWSMLGIDSTISGACTGACSMLCSFWCGGLKIDVVLLDHRSHVFGDDGIGVAEFAHAAGVEPQRAVADRLHFGHSVRDEQDRDAGGAQLVNFAEAALAEIDVADS